MEKGQSREVSMSPIEQAERSLVRLKELAERLKDERKRRGELSLAEVAKQMDLSAPTLSRIEQGKYVPKSVTLAKLCEWLGEPVENFLEISVPAVAKGDTVKQIMVHLRADKKLSSQAAGELIDIISKLYERYSTSD